MRCLPTSVRPASIVRPVVISRTLSKTDPQLLRNTISKLEPLSLLPHSDPPQTLYPSPESTVAGNFFYHSDDILVFCCVTLSSCSFFLLWGGIRSLRMPAMRPASHAGPMRNPRKGTSVVVSNTIRLT